MDWQEAAVVRRTYAKLVVNVVKAGNPRLEAAFAAVGHTDQGFTRAVSRPRALANHAKWQVCPDAGCQPHLCI